MSGIIDLLVPREKKFFDYLERQIIIVESCIKQLWVLCEVKNHIVNFRKLEKTLTLIQKKSVEAEKISRNITTSLHQTFITPIDREEIQSLSSNIGRIIDSVEKIAAGIFYFKIKTLDSYFLAQIKILQKSTHILKKMFKKPLSIKGNSSYIEQIRRLEREGDQTYRKAIGYIFNNGHNSVEVIKKKELYYITEEAIDDTKIVADLFEVILINNS